MSCGCGCTPCSGACEQFSVPSKDSLARCLIPVADSMRDLYTQFGLRPYTVKIVRTKWTVDERGVGAEFLLHEFPILPTPRVSDLTALTEVVNSVGLDEVGSVLLSEVSGRITEDQLRGLGDDGSPLPPDEQVFYEITFIIRGERRRFSMRSSPTYLADQFQWQVRLEKSHEDRDRDGSLR